MADEQGPPDPRADAEPVEVISQSEAKQRADSGGYLANGKPAPRAAVVDMNTPSPGPNNPQPQAGGPKTDDDYWGGPPQSEAPAPQPKKGKKAGVDPDDAYWGGPKAEAPPPAPAPEKPPGMFEGAKAAVGGAYDATVDAASRGMDQVAQVDQAAGSKLHEAIGAADGLFTRFAKNYVQSRDSASQALKESGNFAADSGSGALDPRNVAAFTAQAALALLNEGWSA